MTTASGPDTAGGPGYLQADADNAVLNTKIRNAVREARQEKKLTQAELGRMISASRFVINRIETGATELTREQAGQLDRALDITELQTLVAQRDLTGSVLDSSRDAVVSRMLGAPDLQRLRIVLADETDIYRHLYHWDGEDMRLQSREVEIVIPTVPRERTLFGERERLYGHVEFQIKLLHDLKKTDHYVANSLRIYESDDIVGSMVIGETASGVEAAVWAPLGIRQRPANLGPGALPVATTTDRRVIGDLDAHINALIAGREVLTSNEALCRVTEPEPLFTRYFTVGEDQDEDVDESEGVAVALVLVVAKCPRKHYGVGRRVITYMRSALRQDQRRSLFSNTVEDVDLQRARAAERGVPAEDARSTRGAVAAALNITEYLESHDMVVPDAAFQYAAARGMAMFDLDIDAERLVPVTLPPQLRLIRKPATAGRSRAAIAPRLFVLELRSEPELTNLQAKAPVEEVGLGDLMEDPDLNDFLAEARATGFLAETFARYEIVQH
ncbi:MAG TPA: helix-turn-helix transcriptional regulator [Actinophytocola sp.]|jgi:DNA-binding XRE family transcriptional regulator|nr:helix-turn-helix transcriptional regulator [Actinophytocola sp.]